MSGFDAIIALGILVGIIGAIIQVYPGFAITAIVIAIWGATVKGSWGLTILAGAIIALIAVSIGKYVLAYRQLTRQAVERSTIIMGAVGAAIGFYLLPVIGMVVGFPIGIYLAAWRKTGNSATARRQTVIAVKTVGISILVELGVTLALATWWVIAMIAVR
ncbi:MAG: DUF456 family protein [Bowdeniella nasicola]|nr:DUF456 family protein [Bowdeniella nasicola]